MLVVAIVAAAFWWAMLIIDHKTNGNATQSDTAK